MESVVRDKPPVVSGQSEELSDMFHGGWCLELCHSFDFVLIRFYARGCDAVAEECEFTQTELTFFQLQ